MRHRRSQGDGSDCRRAISFDNKKLLYLQSEIFRRLWISALDGRDARQVTFDASRVVQAAFSPDGKQIASVVGNVDFFTPETRLVLMDREGKNRRVLTSGEQNVNYCSWSFDGKWLAYASRLVQEPVGLKQGVPHPVLQCPHA